MASLSLIALALCALAAVAALWRRPRPLPPGGRHPPVAGGGHWLVGHLLQLSDLQHHIFVRDVVNKHGPVVKLVLPGLGYQTVLADGAAARAALASFPKPWVPYGVSRALSDTFSAGTFSTLGLSPHDLWKRKHTRGSFSLTAVRRGVPGMLRHADRLAAFWAAAASAAPLHPTHPGAVCVDVQATFAALVLDIFGETGLAGYRFGAVDGDGPGVVLLRDLPPAFEEVLMKSPLFWRRLLPAWCSPGRAAALRCVGTTSDVFRDVLRHGRALPPDALEGTLLESLLGLIEAGATEDTTAHSLAWALHCLATHPAEQAALQAELDAALGPPQLPPLSADAKGGPPPPPPFTDAQVAGLRRLGAVINESMRLYPVAADGAMREAPCDTVLPGGWFIKKGEVVRAGGFASHTGTFPGGFANPLDFAPDRWLDGSTASEPAGFLPFSAGPRACAGQSMAQLQLRVLLARFAHLFSFSPAPGAPPVVPVMTLTLFARDGIVLAAAPRAGRRP